MNSEPLILRDFARKGAALDKAQAGVESSNAEMVRLQQQKSEEVAPLRTKLAETAQNAPDPTSIKEEKIPEYQRPTVTPEEMKSTMGAMMAAAMLTGAASRTPYYGVMGAMSSFMDGYAKKDEAMVKESMAVFDKNLLSIREKNEQKRREFDTVMEKYKNNLTGMKIALDNLAAKYDDPMAAAQLRTKSLQDSIKYLETGSQKDLQLLQRLDQMKAHAEEMAQRRAATAQAHADAAGSSVSKRYTSDPEYKKQVDSWARVVATGGTIPARFAQTVGKEFSHDVYMAAPQFAGGGGNAMVANQIAARQLKAEAQKIGTQSAAVAIAGKEVERFIPLAEKAIDSVPRSGWKPINELIRAGANTWSPEQGQLVIANRAVQTAYAQLISRGAPTVHSSEEAEKMLNDADSPAVYKAKLKQIQAEVKQAEGGLKDAHKDLMDRVNQMGVDEPAAAPGAPYSDPDKERRYQEWKAKNGGQ